MPMIELMDITKLWLQGTNAHYKGYLQHLWNSYLERDAIYPTTVHEAYSIL